MEMLCDKEEEWRDIKGYEGRYQVSNKGRVKTVDRYKSDGRHQPEAIRKTELDRHGYEFALLYNENGYKRHSVHVLVANVFIPNDDNKPQINHIDGNKINNNLNNLEWCTASENQLHARKIGLAVSRYGDDNTSTKVPDSSIKEMRRLRNNGFTLQQLADKYSVSFGYVGRVLRNERRCHS